MVNQNTGSMPHGSLEIILQKFGEPDDRIVLSLSGGAAGRRLATLISMWEYVRRYMTVGPWFDEAGRKTDQINPFIEKTLKEGRVSFLDYERSNREYLAQERREGNGISGTAVFLWRSEEHTSELQSRPHLVCRLLLEKKKKKKKQECNNHKQILSRD